MASIQILTDRGKTVGNGHFMRCKALSAALGAKIICSNDATDSWHTQDLEKADIFVVDSYYLTPEKIKKIKQKCKFLAIISDENKQFYNANLIINPNLYGDNIDYSNQNAPLALGKNFMLLRQELIALKKPKPINKLSQLLIILGSNINPDFYSQLASAFTDFKRIICVTSGLRTDELKALEDINLQFQKNIKISQDLQNFQSQKDIQNIKNTQNLQIKQNKENAQILTVQNLQNIQDLNKENKKIIFKQNLNENQMADLFINSDICISSGGSIINELCLFGLCFVAVQTASNQVQNIAYLAQNKIAQTHNLQEQNLVQNLKNSINKLQDIQKRKEVSLQIQGLVGLNGAKNLAKKILDEYNSYII